MLKEIFEFQILSSFWIRRSCKFWTMLYWVLNMWFVWKEIGTVEGEGSYSRGEGKSDKEISSRVNFFSQTVKRNLIDFNQHLNKYFIFLQSNELVNCEERKFKDFPINFFWKANEESSPEITRVLSDEELSLYCERVYQELIEIGEHDLAKNGRYAWVSNGVTRCRSTRIWKEIEKEKDRSLTTSHGVWKTTQNWRIEETNGILQFHIICLVSKKSVGGWRRISNGGWRRIQS